MDKNLAVCYRFYNEKGQRLATFCNYINETMVEIVIIPCSKQDQFSKKEALARYNEHLTGITVASMQVIDVTVVPEEGTLKILFRYAFNNLYERKTIYKRIPVTQLRKIKYA